MGEERKDLLLPVSEWLVTQHPLPLSINGITDGNIGEKRRGGVVGVKAGNGQRICPVAVASTVCAHQ